MTKRGLSETSTPAKACAVHVQPEALKASAKTLRVWKSTKSPAWRNRYHICPAPTPHHPAHRRLLEQKAVARALRLERWSNHHRSSEQETLTPHPIDGCLKEFNL